MTKISAKLAKKIEKAVEWDAVEVSNGGAIK
jgi:hypothetical protein